MIDPFVYFLLFLKASLFSSGGFANLPSLHQDLLVNKWADEADFSNSIALGQITPGPNGLWVICLGYFTYGFLGALFALIAITVPPLLVLVVEAIYVHIEHLRWIPGMMRGISLAVVGISLTVFWTLIAASKNDWRGLLICAVAIALATTKRVNLLLILALAGLAGYFLYN